MSAVGWLCSLMIISNTHLLTLLVGYLIFIPNDGTLLGEKMRCRRRNIYLLSFHLGYHPLLTNYHWIGDNISRKSQLFVKGSFCGYMPLNVD